MKGHKTMAEQTNCPKCGADLPANAPKGRKIKAPKNGVGTTDESEGICKYLRRPAEGLMIAGIVNILCIIPFVVLMGTQLLSNSSLLRSRRLDLQGAMLSLLVTIVGAVIVYGVMRMKELENRKLAVIARVLAVLPVTPGCVLGVPFGVWALITLTKPEVTKAFADNADG